MSQVGAMSSVSESSGVIRPPLYNGKSSFSAWKHKVLAYLQSLGLKDVVVSSATETQVQGSLNPVQTRSSSSTMNDSTEMTSDLITSATKRRDKAYAILLNLLDDSLIELISSVSVGDAAGVWKILLSTYETKSTAQLCQKLDELLNLKFAGTGESFDVYKARFTNLCIEVKEMDEDLSSKIKRYIFLRGLPESYASLVQSLKINDGLSFDQMCVHIKDYYESERRKVDAGTGGGGSSQTAYAFREKRECYLCGKTGHVASSCSLKEKMWCSSCRNKGHTSKHCESAKLVASTEQYIEF
jgi:hypothetical protein